MIQVKLCELPGKIAALSRYCKATLSILVPGFNRSTTAILIQFFLLRVRLIKHHNKLFSQSNCARFVLQTVGNNGQMIGMPKLTNNLPMACEGVDWNRFHSWRLPAGSSPQQFGPRRVCIDTTRALRGAPPIQHESKWSNQQSLIVKELFASIHPQAQAPICKPQPYQRAY